MKFALLFLFAVTSSLASAADLPPVGAYAFDWFAPNTSRCHALKPAERNKMKRCETGRNGFGPTKPTHVCAMKGHGELMVYKTLAQCKEEFETMSANAP